MSSSNIYGSYIPDYDLPDGFENDLEVMNDDYPYPSAPSITLELDPEEAEELERSAAQGEWMDNYLDAIDDYDLK